jgi:cytoskeleton protein RodZ
MQNIGERLEEARKRKGISIREAAETTKIRSDYLQKFEANAFDLDLPPLYIRGFVRSYARFLELDADRFIAEYDSVVAAEGRSTPSRRESRETYGRVEFAEGGEGGASGRPPIDQALLLKYGLLGGGALLILIVIIVLINALTSRSPGKPAASTQASPATTQLVQPPEVAQTLTFTATDTTRVKIVKDDPPANPVIFDGVLGRGETRSFRKVGALLITVEDRTKLRMEVNGRSYGIPEFASGNYGRFRLN